MQQSRSHFKRAPIPNCFQSLTTPRSLMECFRNLPFPLHSPIPQGNEKDLFPYFPCIPKNRKSRSTTHARSRNQKSIHEHHEVSYCSWHPSCHKGTSKRWIRDQYLDQDFPSFRTHFFPNKFRPRGRKFLPISN